MGREMGGSFKREEIYVYLWLIHVLIIKSVNLVELWVIDLSMKPVISISQGLL